MTVEYQPEHILGALFELRETQRLEKRVSKYIQEKGWSYVIELLQKGRELEAIVPRWDIPLRKGVLRDGMGELLQLQDFMGLDVDFVDAFAALEVKNLDDLRTQARERAMDLLGEQVKRGLTFFMDLEAMADTEFAVFVPDALEARIREIQGLGDKPHLYEIYSTYYGFTVLTTGGVTFTQAGVSEEIQTNLLSLLGDIGDVSQLNAKQLKFSPLAFRKCSPHLMVLLWNMLRVALGGRKNRMKALEKLGELGDSRALSLIFSALENRARHDPITLGEFKKRLNKKMKYAKSVDDLSEPDWLVSLQCIGRIGHPRGFDFFERNPNLLQLTIMEAQAGLRHPVPIQKVAREIELFMELDFFHDTWRLLPTVNAGANTRLRRWIPFYNMALEKTKDKNVKAAVERALKNVHPPFDDV